MNLRILRVESKRDLKRFIRFGNDFYKDSPYAIPALESDELAGFTLKGNPALEFCETVQFLAIEQSEEAPAKERIVGRICGMVNKRANERWNRKTVRFGWVDFVDNEEVSRMLLDAVKAWGQSLGMTEIQGPLGFTDMDKEGCLIEGFEEVGTMATIYNYPYYQKHFEAYGLEKEADWIELRLKVPEAVPEAYTRVADVVKRRYGLRSRKIRGHQEVKKTDIGLRIFQLINESYTDLFGFVPMTEAQMQHYAKIYLPILDLDLVCLVERESDSKLIAVGISMASMSEALQKSRGRLWPLGWWHLLKALRWKQSKCVDMLLVGVDREYQKKGVNSILFADLLPIYIAKGFKWAESNPELESNANVQAQWKYVEHRQHKRRRCFIGKI